MDIEAKCHPELCFGIFLTEREDAEINSIRLKI